MIKKEQRTVNVYYCDFCGEKITTTLHVLYRKDKSKLHFHKIKKENEKDNCLVKFKRKQMSE